MSDGKSTLGDCCREHDPLTAPVVLPCRAALYENTDNLRAEYRCECGNEWSCWWSASAVGWTAEDVGRLEQALLEEARRDAVGQGEWFHRGPCHPCKTCGADECFVWNDGVNPEVHICAKGCDGLPSGLAGAA
jgi:hypothetical protein